MNDAKYDDHELAERVGKVVRARVRAAVRHYHAHYDNAMFTRAVEATDASVERSNALLDSAMALCGHPRCPFVDYGWSDEENAFLALFIDQEE